MHPIQIIEFYMVGFLIVTFLIISLLLEGKGRKVCLYLAFVIFVSYCIFYIVRPFWIDSQIEKKVELIKPYLEEQFPGEKWTISTVDHRNYKNKQDNPYTINVTFKSEPDATYSYHVGSKENIYQWGLSSTIKDKWPSEFKHKKRFGKP